MFHDRKEEEESSPLNYGIKLTLHFKNFKTMNWFLVFKAWTGFIGYGFLSVKTKEEGLVKMDKDCSFSWLKIEVWRKEDGRNSFLSHFIISRRWLPIHRSFSIRNKIERDVGSHEIGGFIIYHPMGQNLWSCLIFSYTFFFFMLFLKASSL